MDLPSYAISFLPLLFYLWSDLLYNAGEIATDCTTWRCHRFAVDVLPAHQSAID
jgi:hypothetical protein